jgi:hypothetical protein
MLSSLNRTKFCRNSNPSRRNFTLPCRNNEENKQRRNKAYIKGKEIIRKKIKEDNREEMSKKERKERERMRKGRKIQKETRSSRKNI